jgi:C4-dicarboxylate transporter DctQ subunit
MHDKTSFIDTIEETMIAGILGVMTLITFANVVTRYVFNFNILWGLEVTVFLFAWLVILGSSYALKKSAHLGVDAIINMVSPPVRRAMGLIAGACVLLFSMMMFKGAWDFWAPYGELKATSGRWFPTGLEDVRGRGWLETTSTPIPDFMRFLEPIFNEGERYDKMPRLIPYLVLPLGMGLMFLRACQAMWKLWTGEIDTVIVSHEAEDDVKDAAATLKGQ